jgi:ribosomal protein RSM22 (predicted rRNA methylase)
MKRKRKTQDRIQEILGDVMRRLPLSQGMSDITLPKELLGALQANIEKSRAGVMNVLSREITKVVSRVDAQTVLEEILRNNRIKIQAEIILEPKLKKRGSER